MKFKNKKAQSEVIGTMLIILLTIAASAFLLAFIVPFIKNWISKGECYYYLGKITIKNEEKYTCYNLTAKRLNIKIGFENSFENKSNDSGGILGFKIIVGKLSDTKIYQIKNGDPALISEVLMYNNSKTNLEIPLIGQERTYSISLIENPNQTTIYPILLNGRECSEYSDSIDSIPYC